MEVCYLISFSSWQKKIWILHYNIGHSNIHFSSAQSLSCVQLFETLWTAACQASLSIRNSQGSLKFMSIESVMPSNHLILCHPLFFLPLIFPSIRVFSNESFSHQVAKVLEFQLQHQSFQWIFRLISFRIDWFDLLAVQGTLKSLLLHHSSKCEHSSKCDHSLIILQCNCEVHW